MRPGERIIKLQSGKEVSNYSKEYFLECEAKELLLLSLEQRRIKLKTLEERRGSVDNLKKKIKELWELKGGGNLPPASVG